MVVAVSGHACPQDRLECSQRAFDKARAPAGHPDCPRARSISKRLGVGWREVLQTSDRPRSDWPRAIRHHASDKGRKGYTLDHCLAALAQAAASLQHDKGSYLSRAAYQQAHEAITAADRSAWRHGPPLDRIPSLTQIDTVLIQEQLTWAEACSKAGLPAQPPTTKFGMSPEAAVAAFADEHDRVPASIKQLRRWAQATGRSLSRMNGPEFKHAVTAHNQNLTIPLPAAATDPTFEPAAPGGPTDAPPRLRQWNETKVKAGLAAALRLLDPGESLDQRTLTRLAAQHPEHAIPRYNQVRTQLKAAKDRGDQNATWDNWIREARGTSR